MRENYSVKHLSNKASVSNCRCIKSIKNEILLRFSITSICFKHNIYLIWSTYTNKKETSEQAREKRMLEEMIWIRCLFYLLNQIEIASSALLAISLLFFFLHFFAAFLSNGVWLFFLNSLFFFFYWDFC